jgi:hypothetical protein
MTDSSVAKAAGAAEPPQQNQTRLHLTLRAQGLILLVISIILVLSYGAFIASQREMLVNHFVALENQEKLEEQFVRICSALFRVDREVDDALSLSDPASAAPGI